MLSKEDNELLTRIGPITPMGHLMRQYWLPIYLSSDLPENDRNPVRVKLLHEDLVILRDSQGRVVDRRREHLGTADAMIIRVRQRLLEAVKVLRDYGTPSPGLDDPDAYRVRTAIAIIDEGVSWLEAAGPYLKASTDLPVLSAEAQQASPRIPQRR